LKNKTLVFLFVVVVAIIFLIIDHFHNEKIEQLTHNKYINNSYTIKKYIEQSLQQKKQQGLSIALSLAQNKYYIDFFQNNSLKVDLQELSQNLKQHTNQQNVWIHFVSKDGISLYRSWAKKKGDNVARVRKELPALLKDPKPTNLISVGIFDLSFKSIVPVYKENNFLGIIEVITKVNSISDNLKDIGYTPVVLVDKKYKKQLKKPFTKTFVDDYYIANTNASKDYLQMVEESLHQFLSIEEYTIIDDKLITIYHLNDIFGKKMAYFIIFEDLQKIETKDINNLDKFIKTLGIFLLLLILAIIASLYFYNRSKYTKDLEKQVDERTQSILKLKDYHSTLFDGNPNIIFVAVINHGIIEANKSFFKLFHDYNDLDSFNKHNNCLCKFAVEMEDATYINPNSNWAEQIILENRKLCIKRDNEFYHFRLEAKVLDHSEYTSQYSHAFIVTLTDITKLINTQNELNQKQSLMFEQAKLADMGEMIGNIAHQWRQPLSVISTASTGILMYKEMDALNDELLEKEMTYINDNAQYLSKTIDDFRDFIKGDRVAINFNLAKNIDKFLNLVTGNIKSNNINVILDIKEDIVLYGYPNELTQCFINIFNNAKDAFNSTTTDEKYFFIATSINSNTINITLKDNAGGIPQEIKDKVFEPYFTTKHQSKGTGLGLSMTYSLITDGMDATIETKNVKYIHESIEHYGAEFSITLPYKQ
jgi:signal transduction histidine kinase